MNEILHVEQTLRNELFAPKTTGFAEGNVREGVVYQMVYGVDFKIIRRVWELPSGGNKGYHELPGVFALAEYDVAKKALMRPQIIGLKIVVFHERTESRDCLGCAGTENRAFVKVENRPPRAEPAETDTIGSNNNVDAVSVAEYPWGGQNVHINTKNPAKLFPFERKLVVVGHVLEPAATTYPKMWTTRRDATRRLFKNGKFTGKALAPLSERRFHLDKLAGKRIRNSDALSHAKTILVQSFHSQTYTHRTQRKGNKYILGTV